MALGHFLSLATAVVDTPQRVVVRQTGIAMEPTLSDGQEVTVVEQADFDRFDLAVYRSPSGDFPHLAGRIIGLPGETIEIRDGHVLIDGRILADVATKVHRYSVEPVRVSENAFYILGDNRNYSIDSHIFGEVPKANIIGGIELETN